MILSQREAQDVAAGYVPNAVKAVICSMLDWDEIEQRKSDARAAATTRLRRKDRNEDRRRKPNDREAYAWSMLARLIRGARVTDPDLGDAMIPMNYADFLASKRRIAGDGGVDTRTIELPPQLYDWQAAIVRWALRKGRAAIFADCGLGKTFMQIAWAQALGQRTLILAPLCVAEQTVSEATTIGVTVRYARSHAEAQQVDSPIVITNYERLDAFDVSAFRAVVLDEVQHSQGVRREDAHETHRDVSADAVSVVLHGHAGTQRHR